MIQEKKDGTHRRVKEYIIDSSQIQITSYTDLVYATIPKPTDYPGYNNYNNFPILCTCAKYKEVPDGWSWESAGNIGSIFSNADNRRWWIGFPTSTTLVEMQQILANQKILYPLAEEVIEPYIEEEQELLNTMHTFKSTTNITINNNIKPTIDVEYYKDLETLFKNLSNN